MTNVFIDLRLLSPLEVPKDEFFEPAFGSAIPGSPVHVYRDLELTDLFAVVWADGGVDYHR